MEIKKGQIISDQLAEILRNRTTTKERAKLAKKHKIHVNSINNKIIENRQPVVNEKLMYDLCELAFRNNDNIIKEAKGLRKILNKLLN